LKSSRESKMFKNILVAYDESPTSGRAPLTGIHLAKRLNGDLRAVSVQENLPPYAGNIHAEVPGATRLLRQQAADYDRALQTRAQQAAQREGVFLTTEPVEEDEVQAIMECVQRNRSDLPCWACTGIP
jgi:nucleotide-binding universal stress UspA family protein